MAGTVVERLAGAVSGEDPAPVRTPQARAAPGGAVSGRFTVVVLTEPARKAVEVAVHRGRTAGELDLLRGLLADARTPAVRALTRAGVDVRRVAACLLGQNQ